MSKASISIVFFTILTQLHGQGDGPGPGAGMWGRYRVPIRNMARAGIGARPLLRSPSTLISTNETPLGGGSDLSFRGSGSLGPILSSTDLDAIGRRNSELDSVIAPLKSALSQMGVDIGEMPPSILTSSPSKRFSDPGPTYTSSTDYWRNRPAMSFSSRLNNPEPPSTIQSPSASSGSRMYPDGFPSSQPVTPEPVAAKPYPPVVSPMARSWSRSSSFSKSDDSPSPQTPPPSPPPSTSTLNRQPSFSQNGGSSVSSSPSSNSTPPASCAASNANATPPINQYRRWPTLRRNETLPNDLNVEPNKIEKSPSPVTNEPPTLSAAPGNFNNIGNKTRRNDSASDTKRFKGSAIVTEQLPNESDSITIKISGMQIDDDRMSQMIKEAKNAITAVFHGPMYKSMQRGTISFRKAPPHVEF